MDWATLFGNLSTDATSSIETIVPYALGIAGTLIALRVGVRVFKGFAK